MTIKITVTCPFVKYYTLYYIIYIFLFFYRWRKYIGRYKPSDSRHRSADGTRSWNDVKVSRNDGINKRTNKQTNKQTNKPFKGLRK